MIVFNRTIEPKIRELLFKKRAILIFGHRQTGKTTLAKKILAEFGQDGEYFNCDTLAVRKHFLVGEPEKLKELVQDKKIVVFDEAQTIQNIGIILKVFIDTYPDVQIITTGSSSFDLANKINEPLTGRSFEFTLYPLSIEEIKESMPVDKEKLFELMRLGSYPAIVGEPNAKVRENLLKNITTNYLYKDIFIFESIKNPKVFEDLLKLLAHQIGSLVSVNELAVSLETNRATIDKYLKLLEQTYIIKKVNSFSRNHRNELKKAFKIYFIDIGIRNVVIDMLDGPISERQDKGALFENFFYTEKIKKNNLEIFPPKIYFWRTRTKYEVDFVESHGNTLKAYECKWKKTELTPTVFLKAYPDANFQIVSPEDFI